MGQALNVSSILLNASWNSKSRMYSRAFQNVTRLYTSCVWSYWPHIVAGNNTSSLYNCRCGNNFDDIHKNIVLLKQHLLNHWHLGYFPIFFHRDHYEIICYLVMNIWIWKIPIIKAFVNKLYIKRSGRLIIIIFWLIFNSLWHYIDLSRYLAIFKSINCLLISKIQIIIYIINIVN